jgi:hypothetical protein
MGREADRVLGEVKANWIARGVAGRFKELPARMAERSTLNFRGTRFVSGPAASRLSGKNR